LAKKDDEGTITDKEGETMAALVVKYHANKVTFDEMEKQRQSLERQHRPKSSTDTGWKPIRPERFWMVSSKPLNSRLESLVTTSPSSIE